MSNGELGTAERAAAVASSTLPVPAWLTVSDENVASPLASVFAGAYPPREPVPTSASDVERRAFELTNAERQASGLRFLMWDESLARLARFHSRNMAEDHFFSHRSPDGEMVDDRANKLGIVKWIGIGENIAYLNGYADPATIAVGKWMKSPLHKQNILNGQWQASAIGAAIDKDGKIYLTQVFIMR